MKNLLVGASPKARLVLDLLDSEGRADEVVGVVDRDVAKRGSIFCRREIMGDLNHVLECEWARDHAFCVCLSERYFADRVALQERIENSGHLLASLVSKHARISESATIGAGSIIFAGVHINTRAAIGKGVTAYTGALIEHDCVIADNVEISPRASLAGGVRIGGHTLIGINATVLPNVVIGSNVIIGGGSVVTKDVVDHSVVVGNPGKVIRKNI